VNRATTRAVFEFLRFLRSLLCNLPFMFIKTRNGICIRACLVAGVIGGLCGGVATAIAGPADDPTGAGEAIRALLTPIRERHGVPAIAGAIVTGDGRVLAGVVGERKAGTDVPATTNDLWHLGSETKAMTATLVARLVERGELRWSSPMKEVFPDISSSMHPDMKGVTVQQLLCHRAGLPPNLDLAGYRGDDVRAERLRAVREYLAAAPQEKPGSKMLYSNLGYIVAGAIVEKITDTSWEEAIRAELFKPLGMASAGFGGTGTPGEIDQPWGHGPDGKSVMANGPAVDNPPVMGPAGRVHCTIQDWAKFIADQLRGARGGRALLKPESYAVLHAPPPGGDYALGWAVTEREWGGGTVLNHTGDNTMNHANVWIAPKRDFAVLVCVNQGGPTAFKASDEAASALIRWYNSRTEPPKGGTPTGRGVGVPASAGG
jgi:CubicO group peptidase (beta-lactamase class C family)